MAWTVYMLRCGDGTLYTGCTNDLPRRLAAHQSGRGAKYTGCTNDLPRRLAAHQSGRGAKYTRSRPPVALVYREEAPDRSAALRREAAIKHLDRRKKLTLIAEKEKSAHGDPAAEEDGQPSGGQQDLRGELEVCL